MYRNRVIPVLTLANDKLVKTVRFSKPNYIGDPVNAVKIFNDKMVDELILLDITATKENRSPNFSKIEEICCEAFMPFAYGGGIRHLDEIKELFQLGIEKVVLNTILAENFALIKEAAAIFGSQSIIASVDVKKKRFGTGYSAFTHSGKKRVKKDLFEYLQIIQNAGAGELFLNVIDRDGTYLGYDLNLINSISNFLDIPLVVCGGASSTDDFKKGIKAGASAVAAGSLFIYRGNSRGILINYPSQGELKDKVFK